MKKMQENLAMTEKRVRQEIRALMDRSDQRETQEPRELKEQKEQLELKDLKAQQEIKALKVSLLTSAPRHLDELLDSFIYSSDPK